MSSLAASRADNFYFPPEWRPEYGGISKFQGSKGANQYQKYGIIRFELPFDAWCLKCERHMSKGLRFNAKKDKDGKYFSTTIYRFTMKCYSCDQEFVIKTDPANDTYAFVDGLRKMEQDFEPEFNDSIVKGVTDEERALLANDPMYRLQHEQEDKARATTANERLASLVELRDSQGLNDYNLNAALRAKNRERKRKAAELLREGEARGLPIPLVEESEQDAVAAKKAVFRASSANKFAQSERSKMTALKTQSIFKSSSIREKSGACSAVATTKVSAEVSKRKRLEVAMKKQAVVNINTRGLRLADMTKASVVSRVSAVRIDSKPLDNAAKLTKLSEAEPSTSDRAISLLQSAYGSDECDSN